MMNILRFIVLGVFGESEQANVNLGTIIYFAFSAIVFLACIVLLIKFTKSDYYNYLFCNSQIAKEIGLI